MSFQYGNKTNCIYIEQVILYKDLFALIKSYTPIHINLHNYICKIYIKNL